jgi:hypothetical protein
LVTTAFAPDEKFHRLSISVGKGFGSLPAISTREIRFDGSSAILVAAIKMDECA